MCVNVVNNVWSLPLLGPSVRHNADQSVTVCHNFMRWGCTRGDGCHFYHPPPHQVLGPMPIQGFYQPEQVWKTVRLSHETLRLYIVVGFQVSYEKDGDRPTAEGVGAVVKLLWLLISINYELI